MGGFGTNGTERSAEAEIQEMSTEDRDMVENMIADYGVPKMLLHTAPPGEGLEFSHAGMKQKFELEQGFAHAPQEEKSKNQMKERPLKCDGCAKAQEEKRSEREAQESTLRIPDKETDKEADVQSECKCRASVYNERG
ncbi:hypothetical protein DFJ58DRAFT_849281 [Suillus subalutaceus]|uniref:uncharacterized protein n=1 Tax=Suillus subalutaceus TaxID=48586 RepID=UPI001B86B018|nr:uncharacterized protein DFJ58DRAFT_849281 [Suillus subalutaceus]KAG1827853.1 hypothetical protein DFJ58DRAFT_849281 [Suillus subalutaceus]